MNTQVNRSDNGAGAVASAAIEVDGIAGSILGRKFADYAELSKLRISMLVLLVTAVGFCMGSPAGVDVVQLLSVLLGTALVAIGANTLNQVLERDYDRLMRRTQDRPIPSGRISAGEALLFGSTSAIIGVLFLGLRVNILCATLAATTFILYVAVYTPLKRVTTWNTLVGAVPGALPPVIGFAGAANRLDVMAWLLFGIVFVWQMPHFFSIAWIYREDYGRGGYKMLSVEDPSGIATGRQTIFYAILLIMVSVIPTIAGLTGIGFALAALALGLAQLAIGVRMALVRSVASARLMLLASVIYLPGIMFSLLLSRLSL
jgi:protoheme IX farnesyltransferase